MVLANDWFSCNDERRPFPLRLVLLYSIVQSWFGEHSLHREHKAYFPYTVAFWLELHITHMEGKKRFRNNH
jgi:hypothetical protein